MSGKPVRLLNVTPLPQIKVKAEPLSDDDEDSVACRICSKNFASDIALRNHARMEHFEIYAEGDPNRWTSVSDQPSKRKVPVKVTKVKVEENAEEIKQKTQAILSSMAPGKLMDLVSHDVSYIIIKDEPNQKSEEVVKRKRVKLMKVNQAAQKEKEKEALKKKEPQPITGPFECVQPSNLVEDGVCHQIFFSCCEYSRHYRDEHTRRSKGVRCQVCEKPLSQADGDKAPYTCEVCGLGYYASKELSDHVSAAHVKLKPFQCDVCHKRFTQQGGVQQHMRMHTGVRPFPCTFCGKAFTQKSGLDQHLRIHTKVKPYRCVVCGKCFCQSVHLKQHMRTHTNVAPFQCGICQKRFKQSSHLNYHLRNHDPAKMSAEMQAKYSHLVGLITRETDQLQQVDQEVELEQVAAEQSIQIVEADDGEYVDGGDQEYVEEQVAAEQSIQEEVLSGDEYILGTDEPHTWQVQLVHTEQLEEEEVHDA